VTRVLFDINAILDVLLDREPYAEASAAAWSFTETGGAEGMLAAHAVTTIHYLLRKEMGTAKARRSIRAILDVFRVAAVDAAVIHEAAQSAWPDFEGAVTAAAARLAGCDYIVTRDPKGYRNSPVRPVTPVALIPLLRKS
jgi:predicted nucleic acid-binding protein